MTKVSIVRGLRDRKETYRKTIQGLVKGGAFKKSLVFTYNDVVNFWYGLVDLAVKEVLRVMKMKSISEVPSRGFIWSVLAEVGKQEFERLLKKSRVEFAMVYDMHKWVMVRTGGGFVGTDISQKALEDVMVYEVREAVKKFLKKK
jgi:hypothetical protein